ncbi:hypothetical protein CL622_00555 [archaeon]|nr:hypothetical protein [archaeon]
MDKTILKQVISEQKLIFEKKIKIIDRTIPAKVYSTNKIVVITGIRRCGKSTLLRQISKKIKNYGYVNFEDERFLNFNFDDFNNLLECFLEKDTNTFFFDEIQNIYGWEKFVRRLFSEGYKIFVTGSNANLLSSEIATSLTGRNLKIELYPFSFKEYLSFKEFKIKKLLLTEDKAALSKFLKEYIKFGGFPEILHSKDFEELNQIYQDVIIKDLLVRQKIRDHKDFRELALYILSNVSKRISYNNLKKILNFSNTSKVKDYIEFLSEAYLVFELSKYDTSIKKQMINDRKVYAIDTGLINSTAFQFSENKGRLLENIVYLELIRRKKEVYYYQDKCECDFIIREGRNLTQAIQVSVTLLDPKTRQREIKGLKEAMSQLKVKKGFIITLDQEDFVEGIQLIPVWKWLLDIKQSKS